MVRLGLLAIPVGDAIWFRTGIAIWFRTRSFFSFLFFSATILYGPYLWNRDSQRLVTLRDYKLSVLLGPAV